jgi:hypothetical protein
MQGCTKLHWPWPYPPTVATETEGEPKISCKTGASLSAAADTTLDPTPIHVQTAVTRQLLNLGHAILPQNELVLGIAVDEQSSCCSKQSNKLGCRYQYC